MGLSLLAMMMWSDVEPLAPLEAPPNPPPELTVQNAYLKTVVEETLLLGLGTLWYWRSPSLSDADINWDWTDWKAKLFSTKDIVWDDNLFDTNVVSHPRAGFSYYQIARGNGFGFSASFLSAVLASTAWEYLSEFIEKPSLNDLIVTPVAGTVIGEASYQVGRYFASGPPNAVNQLGALVFSPVATINSWASGHDAARVLNPMGERQPWHRFEFGAGASRSAFSNGSGRDDVVLNLGDRIISNHLYLRPGEGMTPVAPGQWTEISGRLLLDSEQSSGIDFHSHVLMWGRYLRDYDEVPPGTEPSGWGAVTGLSASFDYYTRTLPNIRDHVATIGIIGPMLEVDRQRGGLRFHASAATRWGIALVTSLAYPAVAAELNGSFIKSVLRQQDYYYAQGLFSTAGMAVGYKNVELAVGGRLDAFWSVNARDRYQSKIQDDFSLDDQRASIGAALSTQPWPGPVRVVTSVERLSRRSHLLDQTYLNNETRATVAAAVVF
jgi:hypothetical protein